MKINRLHVFPFPISFLDSEGESGDNDEEGSDGTDGSVSTSDVSLSEVSFSGVYTGLLELILFVFFCH